MYRHELQNSDKYWHSISWGKKTTNHIGRQRKSELLLTRNVPSFRTGSSILLSKFYLLFSPLISSNLCGKICLLLLNDGAKPKGMNDQSQARGLSFRDEVGQEEDLIGRRQYSCFKFVECLTVETIGGADTWMRLLNQSFS